MNKIILVFFAIPSFFFSQNQITEKNYKLYDIKKGKVTSLEEIAQEMKQYDVLFFGEEHNDSVTHFAEQKMFELLSASFKDNLALSMEMFDRDVQGVMNEYLQGFIREKNFTKDARVWSNYRDYRKLIEFAKDKKLEVVCANAASRYTNLAGRKGQKALMTLPKESKANFAPLPYDTATGAYYNKLMEITHGSATAVPDTAKSKVSMIPMGQFNLVMAQSLWDATMAYSISQQLKKNPTKKILHLNGKFHSDEGFGVVAQLKKYRPKVKVLILSSASDDKFPDVDYNQYKNVGDYILITDPGVPKTFSEK